MLNLRYTHDSIVEMGVDEAGRGPLWGPLMAAAVILPNDDRELFTRIKDSKKISPKKRLLIEKEIKEVALSYGIGQVSAAEIDMWGATVANQTAFRRAIQDLYSRYSLSDVSYYHM